MDAVLPVRAPRAPRAWAPVCAAIAIALVVASALAAVPAGWGWDDVVSTYTLTNTVIGLALVGSGAMIGWHRPRNLVGIVFVIGGFGHLVSAVAAPLGQYGLAHGWPAWTTQLLAGLFLGAWGLGLPTLAMLALLLFPDGRPPSPLWRPVAWYLVALAVSGLLLSLLSPYELVPGEPASRPLFAIDGLPAAQLEEVYGWVSTPALFLVFAALIVRYVRGDERTRRQLLWLILALVGMVVINLQRWITGDGPILLLLSTVLIPIAIAIAIVRYQLLDIRLVLSRTLLYATLVALVIAVYAALVALLTLVVPAEADRFAAIAAAVVVALLFNPLRMLLQRIIARAMYGTRDDALRTMAGVSAEEGLDGVLARLRGTLRLPRLAVVVGGAVVAADGERPDDTVAVDVPAGEDGAVLEVTLRRGERRLHRDDRRALALVIPSIGLLLRERALTDAVQQARAQAARAREQERKTLHRELHDGLGPVLTGAVMRMDAAANLLDADTDRARSALGEARTDVRDVLGELRRVVYGLRPVALDAGGLVGALDEEARGTQHPLVQVRAAPELPALSPAVELAAYRVVMEALTNARRHSDARCVTISMGVDAGALAITVDDDGVPPATFQAGVGLCSVRERVEELGGTADAGPIASVGAGTGWRVSARIPLG